MNQMPMIHSQTVMSESVVNGWSSVNTKYDSTARNARYDAYGWYTSTYEYGT